MFENLKTRVVGRLVQLVGVLNVSVDVNKRSNVVALDNKSIIDISGNTPQYCMLKAFSYVVILALFPLSVQAEVTQRTKPAMGLEQLISAALSTHPAAQVQRSLEQSARADVDSANWQFYPTFSYAVENARSGEFESSSSGDSTVSILRLQQPLWAGGRLTAGLEKAEAGVMASQASLAQTRQQLALRVVQAYGEWLAARLKMSAYEKSRVTHVRLRDQVNRRIQQGASAKSDLTLAVSRLQSVVADHSVASAQIDIALSRLGQLLGMDPSLFEVTISAPRTVSDDVQQLLDRALDMNPGVRKAQAESRVQKAVIAERRADLSPEVFVRVERQYGNQFIRNTDPENRVVLGVDSRFGAGLSSISNVKGATARYQAALAEVEVQQRNIRELVIADNALATSSRVRLQALRVSLDAAKQVSESYDRQFLAGRKTWLDVMNAARELAQTEVRLADIHSTQVIVTWRLAIYTQGLDNQSSLPVTDGLIDSSINQAGSGDAAVEVSGNER